MQNFSVSVLDYICSNILTDQSPAYILVDTKGYVRHTGGGIKELLATPIQPGTDITEALCFMQGLLPLDRSPLMLSHVGLESGLYVNVYIYNTDDGYGLLLVDVTQQETMLTEMQQKANELILLRERQAGLIEQKIHVWNYSDWKNKLPDCAGDQIAVSVLFVTFMGLESIGARTDASTLASVLEKYSSALMRAIHMEGGIVLDIFGTKFMAVFGMPPSSVAPTIQSLKIVEWIQTSLRNQGNGTHLPPPGSINLGMTVTSGKVGIQTTRPGSRFIPVMIGQCVENALIMHVLASDMGILVDRTTYENAGQYRDRFVKKSRRLETMAGTLEVFVWENVK